MDEEQLELFEEESVYVRMVVTYTLPAYPGIPHAITYQFVDRWHDCPISNQLMELYQEISEDVEIDIWHDDVPAPTPTWEDSTHYPETVGNH